jgi:uncharacterized protein YbjT (DUF2867 family)
MTTAFIAGATGYTGRNVVSALTARGIETVAHVRPDSRSLDQMRTIFTAEGASVDTSPWTPQGMASAMASHRPDFVFALLGTTAKRGKVDGSTYESVDYGLTVMLLEAAAAMDPRPCFVYLSAAGAGGLALGGYMRARARVEQEIVALGIPHLIARPSFITGDDREEDRPAERIGAKLVDAGLGSLAALGVPGPRAALGSITGPDLGEALVRLAVEGHRGVVEAADLHRSKEPPAR